MEELLIAYLTPSWSTQHVFYQTDAQNSNKITNFGHQISPGNVTPYHEDRYPLLLECFIAILRVIGKIVRASDSISDSLMVKAKSFPPNKFANFTQIGQFWSPDEPEKMDNVS